MSRWGLPLPRPPGREQHEPSPADADALALGAALPPATAGSRAQGEDRRLGCGSDQRPRPGRGGVYPRAVADGAGTAPASIYHYFPDAEAVIAAVATEYMEGLLAATAKVHAAQHTSYEVHQRALVHAFWRYFAARPGLRELWFQRQASDAVIAIHERYLEIVAEQLQAAAARYIDDPGELLDYQMVLEISGALFQLAFKLDPGGDPRVIEEIHVNAWAFLNRRALKAEHQATRHAAPAGK